MTGIPLIAAAACLLAAGAWLGAANRSLSGAMAESLAIRKQLQEDPATAVAQRCGDPVPLAAIPGFSCQGVLEHRRRNPAGWVPASCFVPAGRPARLEPVRFRRIRVCCSLQGRRLGGQCLFQWRLAVKS